MEDKERNEKIGMVQAKISALLAKEFPGESNAFFFFSAKIEGNNVKASFSSKTGFDKSAPLSVWQAYATGVQNYAQNVFNDIKPPELNFAQPKPVDRATS